MFAGAFLLPHDAVERDDRRHVAVLVLEIAAAGRIEDAQQVVLQLGAARVVVVLVPRGEAVGIPGRRGPGGGDKVAAIVVDVPPAPADVIAELADSILLVVAQREKAIGMVHHDAAEQLVVVLEVEEVAGAGFGAARAERSGCVGIGLVADRQPVGGAPDEPGGRLDDDGRDGRRAAPSN
jgi:hypothetical protein